MLLQPTTIYFITTHFLVEFPCQQKEDIDSDDSSSSLFNNTEDVDTVMYVRPDVTTYWRHNQTFDTDDVDIIYYHCPHIGWDAALETLDCPLLDTVLMSWLLNTYHLQCSRGKMMMGSCTHV